MAPAGVSDSRRRAGSRAGGLSVLVLGIALAPFAAAAPPARLQVGDHVMIARHYDHERDVFIEGARDGEGEACFLVTEIREDGAFLDHQTGWYKPWWSEEAMAPGDFDNLWFTSDGYRENHPEADALEQLRRLLRTVPACR